MAPLTFTLHRYQSHNTIFISKVQKNLRRRLQFTIFHTKHPLLVIYQLNCINSCKWSLKINWEELTRLAIKSNCSWSSATSPTLWRATIPLATTTKNFIIRCLPMRKESTQHTGPQTPAQKTSPNRPTLNQQPYSNQVNRGMKKIQLSHPPSQT